MGCIHSKQHQAKFINNVPQIQINLVKVYKYAYPHKTEEEIAQFQKSLSSNSVIFNVVQDLEIKLLGKPNNGNSNLDYRVEYLLEQIQVG
jgi:hypothetical protein